MKTRNNVQKAITKTLAVIISLVLISITVQAQEFWQSVLNNSSFHQIALAMVDGASVETPSTTKNSEVTLNYEEEADAALNVEEWMIDESYFSTVYSFETEVESSLELENWMVNENLFNGYAAWFSVETEEALELEDWMTNQEHFGVRTVEVAIEQEEELQLEAWMTSSETWKI
jgi:hypothetical protein